jgi:hypothetical protein
VSDDNIISHNSQISGMIETYRTKDPRLATILSFIAGDLHDAIVTLSPIQTTVRILAPSTDVRPDEVEDVVYSLLPRAVQIAWSAVSGAVFYEIRTGADWDVGSLVVKTPSLGAALNPMTVGTHGYRIKALTSTGKYSPVGTYFEIVVPALGTPSISSQVIDNNVLLYWTIPSSAFEIDHYNVYKEGVEFAQIKGSFITRFEAAAGTYSYSVEAVDIAGNISPLGVTSATVRQPPDYVLQDEYITDFSPGTFVNAVLSGGKLIACVDLTETFQAHFTSKSWTSPQDQVTAGYDYYIQDNLLTGSYEEKIDYGTILTNIIVNVTYIKEIYSGTSDVTVVVKMAVSDDDVSYSSWSSGVSQFFQSFRYLKIRLEFTAPNDDAMIALSTLKIALNVKREVDSGSVDALASDSTGTVALFNKAYKDVDSVTAETDDIQPLDVVVDFVDVPNPTSFKVYVFDGKGQRVDATVYWKARGIV